MTSQAHKKTHDRLENDFPYFARHALKIKDKEGSLVPFVLNSAQEYLHGQLERQRANIGKVRTLIVKGRQQGCSTYIGGRYYHRAIRKKGQSVFILSHEAETTKKLFRIVERYYENTPVPVRPPAKIANKREFIFDQIQSEYGVGTAGNKDVGRGGTIQLFHGSEVAFWENTDELQTGILQSIADADNTEIVLESTANGMANMFYLLCMDAVAGKNDYQVVFIPWYWQTEYRRAEPHDQNKFFSKEEDTYKRLYDLDNGQMYWRRAKIAEFKSEWKFRQEYPAFLQEAFQTSGNTLINPECVMEARKSRVVDPHAPLVVGVDPSRTGDRYTVAPRRGREALEPIIFKFEATDQIQMQAAGQLINYIEKNKPVKMFVDVAHGYGTIDRMVELGYGDIVIGVHFGSEALEPEIYLNKRAEMWCLMRDWFHMEHGEVSAPDSDALQRDLACMPEHKLTSSGKVQLEAKDLIKKKLGMSPDIGDALALTFAFPVAAGMMHRRITAKRGAGKHTLKALQRMQRGGKMRTYN